MSAWVAASPSVTGVAVRPSGTELSSARLRIAVTRMARWLRPTAAAGALTATEVDLLVAAERRGPARMSDFAAFCGLNPTMLSRMVPKLEGSACSAGRWARPTGACALSRRPTRHALCWPGSARSVKTLCPGCLAELEEPERRAIAAATPALEKLAERLRNPDLASGTRRPGQAAK